MVYILNGFSRHLQNFARSKLEQSFFFSSNPRNYCSAISSIPNIQGFGKYIYYYSHYTVLCNKPSFDGYFYTLKSVSGFIL